MLYAEVTKIYGKSKFSIHEIMKKEKEICANLLRDHIYITLLQYIIIVLFFIS